MSSTTVLVVEDESDLVDLYVGFLEPQYDVRTAGTVDGALMKLDDTVDAVLLDRHLPNGSGDDVIEEIRANGHDCRIAMITAIEPDFDIVDMGFDLYLTKPVTRSRVQEAVETLETRQEYGGMLQEAASLATKRALLKAQKTPTELEQSDAYDRLLDRLDDVDADLTKVTDDFSPADYRVMFRDIGQS